MQYKRVMCSGHCSVSSMKCICAVAGAVYTVQFAECSVLPATSEDLEVEAG